jgi:hypothetical protein
MGFCTLLYPPGESWWVRSGKRNIPVSGGRNRSVSYQNLIRLRHQSSFTPMALQIEAGIRKQRTTFAKRKHDRILFDDVPELM